MFLLSDPFMIVCESLFIIILISYPLLDKSKRRDRIVNRTRRKEVMETLNFLLQNGIITSDEYNNLITKTLPYLG